MFVVPSSPSQTMLCNENDETDKICICWYKPLGGNEIDNYTLVWTKQNVSELMIHTEKHDNSKVAYSFIINDLKAGQKVTVFINANNAAGAGESVTIQYATSKAKLISKLFTLYPNKNIDSTKQLVH